MRFRDPTADGGPRPAVPRRARFGPATVEALEHLAAIRERDAVASVGHGQLVAVSFACRPTSTRPVEAVCVIAFSSRFTSIGGAAPVRQAGAPPPCPGPPPPPARCRAPRGARTRMAATRSSTISPRSTSHQRTGYSPASALASTNMSSTRRDARSAWPPIRPSASRYSLASRVRCSVVGRRSHDRQGSAQLVGGVRHEPPLAFEGRLQAVQQLVERLGQVAQLVLRVPKRRCASAGPRRPARAHVAADRGSGRSVRPAITPAGERREPAGQRRHHQRGPAGERQLWSTSIHQPKTAIRCPWSRSDPARVATRMCRDRPAARVDGDDALEDGKQVEDGSIWSGGIRCASGRPRVEIWPRPLPRGQRLLPVTLSAAPAAPSPSASSARSAAAAAIETGRERAVDPRASSQWRRDGLARGVRAGAR